MSLINPYCKTNNFSQKGLIVNHYCKKFHIKGELLPLMYHFYNKGNFYFEG